MEKTYNAEDRNVRLLLTAPFLAAVVAAALLIGASIAALGAADEFGYPAWAPTAGGMIFAVPTLLAAALFARATWQKTAVAFRVRLPRLGVGLAAVLGGIALTVSYVVLVGNPESYRGQFNAITLEYDPMYSLESFLGLTALMALVFPMAGVWFLAKVAYLNAIQRLGLLTVQGIDPVGELMKQTARR